MEMENDVFGIEQELGGKGQNTWERKPSLPKRLCVPSY